MGQHAHPVLESMLSMSPHTRCLFGAQQLLVEDLMLIQTSMVHTLSLQSGGGGNAKNRDSLGNASQRKFMLCSD